MGLRNTTLSESQDKTTLNIIEKISDILKTSSESKDCLWKFFWDCGRSGKVEGVFKATKEEVENAIGKHICFGEILGKHSEVEGTLDDCDCELISDEPIFVMNSVESGYNPLSYIYEDEDYED